MVVRAPDIAPFIKRQGSAVLVRVAGARGSTPRDADAFMLVGPSDELGTIGGGQLEYIAIDTARQMLRRGEARRETDIPLGPEIGQCCGGRVDLTFVYMEDGDIRALQRELEQAEAAMPHIHIFGGGHVGRALAHALAPLPFRTVLTDTRRKALEGLTAAVETKLAAMPEAVVRAAPAGSAFVVLTHDHALDFLIMREVLMRGDAAMIGSKSKRAQFRRWFLDEGGTAAQFGELICPIGAQALGNKTPEIIAALVAAEIIAKIGQHDCPDNRKDAKLSPVHGVADGR